DTDHHQEPQAYLARCSTNICDGASRTYQATPDRNHRILRPGHGTRWPRAPESSWLAPRADEVPGVRTSELRPGEWPMALCALSTARATCALPADARHRAARDHGAARRPQKANLKSGSPAALPRRGWTGHNT